ncbi:hypothetical protein P280DRAFT_465508 [Massarina eburnea CBS 473.64]|uniref:Uncharacterized protein n=1 Tax=Massarina eburnea CBS 473.64 TaxID=1395130 RepID=A0A6A6SDV2_9PLEO|nr:hypothetical protein P280DRAFT_465508 [Massarina eburnea CBS 473.64]
MSSRMLEKYNGKLERWTERKKERQERARERATGLVGGPVTTRTTAKSRDADRSLPASEQGEALGNIGTPPRSSSNSQPSTPSTPPPRPGRCVSNLTITPMRDTSPQIDDIATVSSPTHIKSANSLLSLFKTRTTRLQSQISAFEALSLKILSLLAGLPQNAASERRAELEKRAEGLEAILALVTEHCNEVVVLEYALRDMIDEQGKDSMEMTVEKVATEFGELNKGFGGRMREAMVKISVETTRKSLVEDPPVQQQG